MKPWGSNLRKVASEDEPDSVHGLGSMTSDVTTENVARNRRSLHQYVNNESGSDSRWRPYRDMLRKVAESGITKALFGFCLGFALFGGSLWVLFDVPDDPGLHVLDTLMIIVFILFVAEIILYCCVYYKDYMYSFFFFSDVIGTLSMAFEISFLLGANGTVNTLDAGSTNAMVLRATRASKLAARAGRLSKLVKCLPLLLKARGDQEVNGSLGDKVQAAALSEKLLQVLATKVSLFTIVLVIAMPLLAIGQYPEEDYSMTAWVSRLESEYSKAYRAVVLEGSPNSTDFQDVVEEMSDFYLSTTNYYPFELQGFPNTNGKLPSGFQSPSPTIYRKGNIVRQYVHACRVARPGCQSGELAYADFNFRAPNTLQAGMDIFTIIIIISIMMAAPFNLSKTIHKIVMLPLENMLDSVCKTASQILMHVSVLDTSKANDNDTDDVYGSVEIKLLDKVLQKLVAITNMDMKRNEIDAKELDSMGEEARGVMTEMMHVLNNEWEATARGGSVTRLDSFAPQPSVAALPVDVLEVDSFELDVLQLTSSQQREVMLYIFYDSSVGADCCSRFVQVGIFKEFLGIMEDGYHSNSAYHNFTHASDICHTVYRLLDETQSELWLSCIERHALLVSALGHDVGHFGRTNIFLTETKHELALRYNDKSPLENLHCSRLFEICRDPCSNVFERCTEHEYKRARKVAIECILHTDNANHFEMVKDISKMYELTSEICEAQRADPRDYLPQYEEQVLRKDSLLWMELFLHLADVSNPLKPFEVCAAWATRVLQEFFDQGDEEKALGVPIGMLNDRDKVNKPGSQHGFINFLVSPLVFSVIGIFPVLFPLGESMAANLEEWRNIWVKESAPSKEEIEKRDVDVSKVKDQLETLGKGRRRTSSKLQTPTAQSHASQHSQIELITENV